MSAARDPKQAFYISTWLGRTDGKVEPGSCDNDTQFDSAEEALQHAKDNACGRAPLGSVIYECRPIYRVDRGPIRVRKMKP